MKHIIILAALLVSAATDLQTNHQNKVANSTELFANFKAETARILIANNIHNNH